MASARGLNKGWLRKLIQGQPHQIIGPVDNPYLLRWFVIPKNRFVNLYVHQFKRSDDDRALHDHPWWFASLILKGGYWEHRADRVFSAKSWRKSGSFAFRRAKTAHRVELERGEPYIDPSDERRPDGWFPLRYGEEPVWTLILTGPKVREWGFLCPNRWMHWKEFVHKNGCGEA